LFIPSATAATKSFASERALVRSPVGDLERRTITHLFGPISLLNLGLLVGPLACRTLASCEDVQVIIKVFQFSVQSAYL